MLIVEKLPWADTVELTRDVEDVVKTLEPSLPSIRFDATMFQQENFIQTAIDNLSDAILLGFLLVVIILALFLFEWRVALISVLTIPLSITATLLVLYAQDQTINTMTLAGLVIALGALVDDAIIDVENIVRRLRQHRLAGSRVSTAKVILDASLEVRSPIVFATLIIVAASVPVLPPAGADRGVLPAAGPGLHAGDPGLAGGRADRDAGACLIMLRKAPIERRESPVVRRLQRGYTGLLGKIIRRPRPGLRRHRPAAGARPGRHPDARAGAAPALQGAGLPDALGRPAGHVVRRRCSGSPSRRARTCRAIPGVRNFTAHLGQAFQGDEPYGINFGENWISIDPHVDYDETIAAIDEVVADYPGLFRDRKTYLDERTKEVVAGGSEPIVIRLFGPDLHTLGEQAQQMEDILGGIDGVVNEHIDLHTDVPQLDVEVDLAAGRAVRTEAR